MVTLENEHLRVAVDSTGVVSSIRVKRWNEELIRGRPASSGFRINLPLPEQLDHYITGEQQQMAADVADDQRSAVFRCTEMRSRHGTFPISADFRIELQGEMLLFQHRILNGTELPLAEVWYPMLGGLTGIGERADTEGVAPGYTGEVPIGAFRGGLGGFLGNEDACSAYTYPGLSMPWLSLFNRRCGRALYIAEHDEVQRTLSFVFRLAGGLHASVSADNWPTDDEAAATDAAAGVTLARVSYPHTKNGAVESGSFVLQAHEGDWHEAAKLYRGWFLSKFPLPQPASWLRREQAWFSSILYQPEDRVVATHARYGEWMKAAIDIGITTGEVIGWDKGGLERGYPEYVPEEKLGGWEGFRDMVRQVHDAGGRVLAFVNYQILDACTERYRRDLHRYRRMDSFGQTENWMCWGESTLKAALGLDVRRHVPASVAVDGFTELVDGHLVALAEAGVDGLQIDKLCVSGQLDFNPGHDHDADLPMCEDLVQAVRRATEKCRAVNPSFAVAAEASTDRFLPFVDVFYRAASVHGISTLRYAFPEWTACVHTSSPFDYAAVNAALVLGAVLVAEPFNYTRPVSDAGYRFMARYVRDCLALRRAHFDRIFLADYLDRRGGSVAAIRAEQGRALLYRVHGRFGDGKRAIVIANLSREEVPYRYAFEGGGVRHATLAQPGAAERSVGGEGELTLAPERVHLILED